MEPASKQVLAIGDQTPNLSARSRTPEAARVNYLTITISQSYVTDRTCVRGSTYLVLSSAVRLSEFSWWMMASLSVGSMDRTAWTDTHTHTHPPTRYSGCKDLVVLKLLFIATSHGSSALIGAHHSAGELIRSSWWTSLTGHVARSLVTLEVELPTGLGDVLRRLPLPDVPHLLLGIPPQEVRPCQGEESQTN